MSAATGPQPLLAFVTDQESLSEDYDMAPLLAACAEVGLRVEVHDWDDPTVDWGRFDAVVLRSPWSYLDRLPTFLRWCEQVDARTTLLNPLPVVRWTLDKHYLADLDALGVPIIPTAFVDGPADVPPALAAITSDQVVVKPAVGAYSKDVRSFARDDHDGLVAHLRRLLSAGGTALVQPYMRSIDELGETDLIYVDGRFSHAIRKESLLDASGTAGEPSQDVRSARRPEADERATAERALEVVSTIMHLEEPLLYARIDLVRDELGEPRVHEMELCEPSLSLPFTDTGARTFAEAILARTAPLVSRS